MIVSEPVGIHAYQLASILKRLALLFRSLNLTYAQSGIIPSLGGRLVYIGDGESLPYIRETLATGESELLVRKIPIWRIGAIVRQMPATGVWLCVEINRLLLPLMPSHGSLTFPWLRQRVYLDSKEYKSRRRTIEGNFGRKVRKYRYRYQLVQDSGAVKQFYERLYLPHIAARFGDACHARSLGELKTAVRKGFLLQVLCGNRCIAGVVCSEGKDELSAKAFGHLPEQEYSLRLGGLSAAYYFLFEYAAKHSLACVDLMRSRPNSRDGVYCHKHRWGAVAEKDPWPHTAILIYSPEGMPVPAPLESLLVWNGSTFREMGTMART